MWGQSSSKAEAIAEDRPSLLLALRPSPLPSSTEGHLAKARPRALYGDISSTSSVADKEGLDIRWKPTPRSRQLHVPVPDVCGNDQGQGYRLTAGPAIMLSYQRPAAWSVGTEW